VSVITNSWTIAQIHSTCEKSLQAAKVAKIAASAILRISSDPKDVMTAFHTATALMCSTFKSPKQTFYTLCQPDIAYIYRYIIVKKLTFKNRQLVQHGHTTFKKKNKNAVVLYCISAYAEQPFITSTVHDMY